jgi:hypothetical protein
MAAYMATGAFTSPKLMEPLQMARGTVSSLVGLGSPLPDRGAPYSAAAAPYSAAMRHQHVVFLGGPGVRYEEWLPAPALAPWVAVHWRITTEIDFNLRIPPDGCMDLIGEDVVGSFSTFETARLPAGSVSQGTRFHPGGFPALAGVPAAELVDLRLPIADVLPGFRSLERLAAAAKPRDPVVGAVLRAHDVRSAANAARMQRLLLHGRGQSWARTAVEHGYYDEAHMANDVYDLVGATPHALLGSPISPSVQTSSGLA